MREISYSLDRAARVVEYPPTPAHGVIYQLERLAVVAGGGVTWRPMRRAVAPAGKAFVGGAWREMHAELAGLAQRVQRPARLQ